MTSTELRDAGAARMRISATGLLLAPATVTLRQVLDSSLPFGWIPAALPDDHRLTLGAAVAADVHGRNHAGTGSFGHHVRRLDLRTSDSRTLRLSRSQDRDAFWATIGGLGLTGQIVAVELQLRRRALSQPQRSLIRTSSLAETLDVFTELAAGQWHNPDLAIAAGLDPRATDARLGAGLLEISQPNGSAEPFAGLRRWGRTNGSAEPFAGLAQRLPRHRLGWARRLGRGRQVRYEFAVPDNQAWLLGDLLRMLRRAQTSPSSALLTRFGAGNVAALSLPRPGWSLALDLPEHPIALGPALATADLMLARYGGRVQLTPDGRLDPDLLAAMYPRLDAWRAVRDRLNFAPQFAVPARRLVLL